MYENIIVLPYPAPVGADNTTLVLPSPNWERIEFIALI